MLQQNPQSSRQQKSVKPVAASQELGPEMVDRQAKQAEEHQILANMCSKIVWS
jgi:hypothetical protein